jgi:hypothetical protein
MRLDLAIYSALIAEYAFTLTPSLRPSLERSPQGRGIFEMFI